MSSLVRISGFPSLVTGSSCANNNGQQLALIFDAGIFVDWGKDVKEKSGENVCFGLFEHGIIKIAKVASIYTILLNGFFKSVVPLSILYYKFMGGLCYLHQFPSLNRHD